MSITTSFSSNLSEMSSESSLEPPPNSSKETRVIWNNWRHMGDQEVIRESAAKGHHVKLAVSFLSQRTQQTLSHVEWWFNEEVRKWATDLLANKQVFRATHILNNVNLKPLEEITKIFVNTKENELREYLGQHLEKIKKLDLDLKLHWQILNLIENNLLITELNFDYDQTINSIINLDLKTKEDLCALLFLRTYDYCLQPLINSQYLWEIALQMDNLDFLTKWISVQFEDMVETDDLTEFLYDFEITNEMLESMDTLSISEETKEFIYNKFARYGKFNMKEREDLHLLIKRLNRNQKIQKVYEIFSRKFASLTTQEFTNLLLKYCTEKELYFIADANVKDLSLYKGNGALELLKSCKLLAKNINNRKLLQENLEKIEHFLESKDVLIGVFLQYLKKENLHQMFLKQALPEFPVVNIILRRMLSNEKSCGLSRYDLLNLVYPAKEIFSHRFTSNPLPNFKSGELIASYGILKKVDFKFYIKQSRPSMAAIKIQHKTGIFHKARKIAILNFPQKDIVASCICFLELLEIGSEILQIEVFVANLLTQTFARTQIEELFFNGHKETLLEAFETEILKQEYSPFISILGSFDLAVKLSLHYGIKLPEKLLKTIAEQGKWIEFITIIQKYNYPQEQVQHLTGHFFKNHPILYSHLSHALLHDLHYFEQKESIMRDRDSRKYFLSRIGVRKHLTEGEALSSTTSQSSVGSTSSSGLSDYSGEYDQLENTSNLLQTLIKCHNSNDPPKALLHACIYYKYPLFAILATTYEPDSVVTSWLTWLSVSCDIELENCEGISLVGREVTKVLKEILEKGYFNTLLQSFEIFLPDNPLKIFVDFLCNLIEMNLDIDHLKAKLESFKKDVKIRRSNSYVAIVDHEMIYLQNKMWIEVCSLTLLAATLQFSTAPNDTLHLLEFLVTLDLQSYFTYTLPNLGNLLEILDYISEREITFQWDFYQLCDAELYIKEVRRCVEFLVESKNFEEALKVSQVELLPADEILLKKWNEPDTLTGEFWIACNEEFKSCGMSPEKAVHFFENCPIGNDIIRYNVEKIIYDWTCRFNLPNLMEIEAKMWRSFLKFGDKLPVNFDGCVKGNVYYSDIKDELDAVTIKENIELSSAEQTKLIEVINQLLNLGYVRHALRLQKLFQKYLNGNVEILRLSYALAEGLTVPIELTAQERLLLRKAKNNRSYSSRRRTLRRISNMSSVSRSPISSSVGTILEVESTTQDVLSLLETLVDGLSCGEEIGQKILMTYRISANIDAPYRSIFDLSNPLTLLTDALTTDCCNKLELVHDFIFVYNWPKQLISNFLCEQIISAINNTVKSNLDVFTLWDLNLNQDMHLILQLLPDSCSIIGNKLYSYSSALLKAQTFSSEVPDANEVTNIVELLIRSHDCFTADCNMEGISIILKKCHTLINLLLTMKNWTLIVRLLTGIARYNELGFVFHLLRENDQFEFLLRKGNAKDNGLKVALLDYLKKYCPDNRELYKLVAVYFHLYSEVAYLWENESRTMIKNLINISKLEMQGRKVNPDDCLFVELTNTEGARIQLRKAMENYSHAAEYHLEGDKLAKSMSAAKQAELIALQISTLKGIPANGTTTCLLHLGPLQISNLIVHLSFPQALILSEAYNHQTDWGAVLFDQYILRNDKKYLDQYLATFSLKENIVYDVSRYFLSNNITSETGIQNMKILVQFCPSIHTKYRVASELGFSDLVEHLILKDKLIYLKDTVWKKGYME